MAAEFPIVVFAYNRPLHLQSALQAIADTYAGNAANVYLYCDGARGDFDRQAVDETRDVAAFACSRYGFTLKLRESNFGLARSIYEGVTDVCKRHGRVLVLEDDLVTSPNLIHFVGDALERYKNNQKVMQVAAYCPVNVGGEEDSFFLPMTSSWGWATWWRAWSQFDLYRRWERLTRTQKRRFNLFGAYPYSFLLSQHQSGRLNSWAILWYRTVFEQDGLVLYPRCALAQNVGFDGSGTNCGNYGTTIYEFGHDYQTVEFPVNTAISEKALQIVRRQYRGFIGVKGVRRAIRFRLKAFLSQYANGNKHP